MEEDIDELCARAGELGLLGVPMFLFQEGREPKAERDLQGDRPAHARRLLPFRRRLGAAASRAAGGGRGLRHGRPQGAARSWRGDQECRRGAASRAARLDARPMPAFLAGLAALLILVFGGRLLASANPQVACRRPAQVGRRCAPACRRLPARARGASPLAIPLALFGLALLGMKMGSWFGSRRPFGSSHKSPGQKSEVRTEALEMELDHDSGHMEGRCLKGQFAGQDALVAERRRAPRSAGGAARVRRARRGPDRGLSRPARARLARGAGRCCQGRAKASRMADVDA